MATFTSTSGINVPQTGKTPLNAFPNPFTENTTITFSTTKNSFVKLLVLTNNGQEVVTLINNPLKTGTHTITWSGKDNNKQKVPNGFYILYLKTDYGTAAYHKIIKH